MTVRTSQWVGWIAALALAAGSSALAAEPKKSAPAEPSPEVRQQMAAVHQKMADCLRSDRPMAECRTEMANSCQQMVGASGCPMMGSGTGGMGPGMMGGGMMGQPAPEAPKKK
jgi:hypothetical protein